MGTNTIPARTDSTTIFAAHVNAFRTALNGDYVPRNVSGVAENEAGSLGTPTLRWLRSHVRTGHFFTGQVIQFHDFGGALTPGQGWMKCNGDIVNLANYDALHGAGSWVQFIGTSPIDLKNLPDFNNRYAIGNNATAQDGSSPITKVGNTAHQVDLTHSHTVNAHNHRWVDSVSTGTNSFTSSGGGSSTTFDSSGSVIDMNGIVGTVNVDGFTENDSPGTDTALSATQNIQPESIEIQFWMRII